MDKVANLSPQKRRELFSESGALRGMNPAVIEKDFWVCWVLKQLFADTELKARLIFKGGTTLSKVFGLIERFSEDIDLVLDWRLLGLGEGHEDPYQERSRTQRDRFNAQINKRAAQYIAGPLIEDLNRLFARCPEISASIDPDQAQTIHIVYPMAFSEQYLRPEVCLEIGPLASWEPSASHEIQPYAAESFAEVFQDPTCLVIALDAERTFWEKATILHQEAHRATATPSRYSRHYYDLYKMAESGVRGRALRDLQLLEDVVEFKQRFYPCAWARYEDARPGSFKLIPSKIRRAELKKDYRAMEIMIFGEVPAFEVILSKLQGLQDAINALEG
jgi:predicted nucleotidyltransferase component of viral defense system